VFLYGILYIGQHCFIFVAVDDNDIPIGYIYGVSDYDKYQENFTDYIKQVAEIEDRRFLAEALTEMYDHAIYKNDYPAHLHIDILPDYQSKGIGSKLIKAFCDQLKENNVRGVMLIVGSENDGARRFYERNGFELLQDIESGAAYGKTL
jgi:ribosomal protein S18 acetylase RimI-like enzyme